MYVSENVSTSQHPITANQRLFCVRVGEETSNENTVSGRGLTTRRAAAADMHAIPHPVEAVPQLARLSPTVFLPNRMRLSS
jgi:hypothetical protein